MSTRDPSGSARRVRATILGLAALACAIAAVAVRGSSPLTPPVPALVAAAALLVAGELLIVRVRLRGDTMALSMFEAVLVPVLFLVPVALALPMVVLAQLVAARVYRLEARKAMFNLAQWTSIAGIGALVVSAIGPIQTSAARTVATAAAVIAAMAAVNAVAFVTVLAQAQRRPAAELARQALPSLAVGWAINGSLAMLFVAALTFGSFALTLMVVPLVVLHTASRGLAAAAADAERMRGLNDALRALTDAGDAADAIPRFLDVVRHGFGAGRAELTLRTAAGSRLHAVGAGPPVGDVGTGTEVGLLDLTAAAIVDARRDDELGHAVRAAGWHTCIAAPIRHGSVDGVLAIYDRSGHEGFEAGELAVLTALATEAAGAIARAALLEQLVSERRTLQDILASTTDGIFTVDHAQRVRSWNPAMELITGRSHAEAIGRSAPEVLRPTDHRARAIAAGWMADAQGPADIRIEGADGRARWLSCSFAHLPPAEDEPASTVVIARDVTRSRELDRLKQDFIATVSHELRTPLTPIKGFAETLVNAGERLAADDRRRAAASILRQADALELLIDNLLEVARIERGVIELRDEPVDLIAVAERAVAAWRDADPARRIELAVPPHPVVARGDEIWIERIVANLLSNAHKYSPAAEPISVALRATAVAAELDVIDRGAGIELADQERIFERFTRLGDHLTRSTGGTGLGLYIARQLAGGLGGSIRLSSEAGRGATFTLALPAARAGARGMTYGAVIETFTPPGLPLIATR